MSRHSSWHYFARLGLLTLLLSGCVAGPPSEQPTPAKPAAPDTTALEQMAAEGRFLDAALAYSRLAADAKLTVGVAPSLQQHYVLRAAELLMSGNYVPQAYQLLSEIDAATVDPALQIRYALLSAEIGLTRQLADEAQAQLNLAERLLREADGAVAAPQPGSAQAATLLRFHRLQAQAFAQLGNHLEVARERVKMEPLLTDPEAILANQEAIIDALQALSPMAIKTLQGGGASGDRTTDVLAGWLALVNIGHSMDDPQQAGADVVLWRERFPEHPAQDSVIATVLAARPRVLRMPKKIALILPLSNRYAKAASAVRDGFLAAYYAQQPGDIDNTRLPVKPLDAFSATNSATNAASATTDNGANTFDIPASVVPSIQIYDAGDDPALIDQVYQQAINDGAEFVVGPLHKDSVNQLARHNELPVPVLALNHSDQHGAAADEKLPANLFQLGLSPEQEARQVAERAWLDGHSRAAIITPSTEWGDRVAKAFSSRWRQFGGHVVEKQTYDPKQSDYSLPIRRLLNVDESQQREKDLQQQLGTKLEFIPRRRQDIDFIFMAAASKQARLIKPQLRFHHAPKVPVYATSHSYGGSIDAGMDRDMDGVLFCDMPWTLDSDRPDQTLKTKIEALWPDASKRYSRLFALGVDAYRVIGKLNGLRRNRAEYYPGETGDLYLDVANRLQRRLSWAQFEQGVPQRLSQF